MSDTSLRRRGTPAHRAPTPAPTATTPMPRLPVQTSYRQQPISGLSATRRHLCSKCLSPGIVFDHLLGGRQFLTSTRRFFSPTTAPKPAAGAALHASPSLPTRNTPERPDRPPRTPPTLRMLPRWFQPVRVCETTVNSWCGDRDRLPYGTHQP